MPSTHKKPANRLFQGLILVSVALHVVLFYRLAEVYRSRDLSVIELSLEDVSRPEARSIPRPRPRPKKIPESHDIARPRIKTQPLPEVRPLQVEPVRTELPDSLVERVGVPDIPEAPGVAPLEWEAEAPADAGEGGFGSSRDYLDLVRLKIESMKKYPDNAKDRNQEGKVTVRFVILEDGSFTGLGIHRASGNRLLDDAALRAIREASPFPPPPRRFFPGKVPLELTIVFELM